MAVDLEQSLLSKITNNTALRTCWDLGLRPSAFEDPQNARVYEFALNYWVSNSMSLAPSPDVLETEFGVRPPDESDDALPWLVGKLKERYIANQGQSLMLDVAVQINEDPLVGLNELYQEAWRIKEQVASRNDRSNFAESIQLRRDRYLTRQDNSQTGAPLGLPEVDEWTGGTRPGEVAAFAGYAKTGKSMSLVKSTVEARRHYGTPCVFTLEMSIPEWEDRMDAFASGVGYGKMQRGELDMAEVRRLHAAQDEMAALGPIYIERPEPGERTVTHMVNRARQLGSDYIIIDQLSWMETRGRYRERRDQYRELINDLKTEVSRESAGMLPCLLAVQFNREVQSKKGGRGGMENIANAADVEQAVDTAFGLFRNKEMRANSSMVLDILGTRRGDLNSWLLGWYLNNETNIFVRSEYVD